MARNRNVDYCGVMNLLRYLVSHGICTQREANKIASRIAAQYGTNIIIVP